MTEYESPRDQDPKIIPDFDFTAAGTRYRRVDSNSPDASPPSSRAGKKQSKQANFTDLDVTPDLFPGLDRPERIYKIHHDPEAATHNPAFNIRHSILVYQSDSVVDIHDRLDSPPPVNNYARPMLSYVQIPLATTADSGAMVLLHLENRRYAFGNIAEGTQRAFNQRHVGLSKLDQMFISGPVSWNTTGGLLGMILSIADVIASQALDTDPSINKRKSKGLTTPTPSLKIHGGKNIAHMIATARRFVFRKGLPLRLTEIAHDAAPTDSRADKPDWEDFNIFVWYISVKPEDVEPTHGRKRSYDDMEAADGEGEDAQAQGSAAQAEEKLVVQTVIDQMFDSNWNLDVMVETTLHKVHRSATIFVRKDGKLEKYEGPFPGGDEKVEDMPVLVRKPWPSGQIATLPPTTPSTQSLSYIVKQRPRRGKFNLAAAQSLGVDKNDFKHLAAGKSVTTADGVEVTPDMCVDPTIDGRSFAFLDLPDTSYLDAFLARPEWSDEALMRTVDVMYWNLGRGVVQDERLQQFMKDRQTIHHVVFSPEASPNKVTFETAAVQMQKLNAVDPDRFPLPVLDNDAQYLPPDNIFQDARVMFRQKMAPDVKLEEDGLIPDFNLARGNLLYDRNITKLVNKAQKSATDPTFLSMVESSESDIPCRDTEVIALGTGSSLPSKYRNVSATLVRVPGCGSYLFDCGEGTLGQLRRMYGHAKTNEILADLKVIWISHIHADHHLGTASVIKAWHTVTADPALTPSQHPRLFVASHGNMLEWLREYAQVEDYGYSRVVPIDIKGNQSHNTRQSPHHFTGDQQREAGGLSRIDAMRVDHCAGALACMLTWPETGLRIAYSGDCRPSRAFATMARGATLLIHEATLDDELQGDAIAKRHCTMSEALDVAHLMEARRVLLTHFSQRYPGIPAGLGRATESRQYQEEGQEGGNDQVVLLAFDQMHVRLGDFKKAALFLPAVRKMINKYAEEFEDEFSANFVARQ